MNRTAITTLPFSYSKTCDTFRPLGRQGAAARAGLGGESLIDFLEHSAMPNGLVRELVAECRPACIVDGLRHVGFGKSCRVDVANGDVVELAHDAVRELMDEVATPGGDLRVNLTRLTLLPGAPCFGQLILHSAVVARIVDLFAIRQRGKVFQAKVNSNAFRYFSCRSCINFNDDIEEPVSPAISGKAGAILDLTGWKWTRIENAKSISSESECVTIPPQGASLHWNPAKALAAAITKVRASMLSSGLGVLLADGIDSAGAKTKFFTAAGSQVIQIKAGKPFSIPAQSIFLPVIAVVPDEIYRPGLLIQ